LFKMKDYGAAGVPMLPNVSGIDTTKKQIVLYAVLTAITGVIPSLTGLSSVYYGAFAGCLGAAFIYYSIGVYRMDEADVRMLAAKKLFAYSIAYLFVIFLALMIDQFAVGLFRAGGLI
jgi:heme o synthase